MFDCGIVEEVLSRKAVIVLSDDCLIIFKTLKEGNQGEIYFWSTLYALLDLQINKGSKHATMHFFNDVNVNY